MLCWNGSLKIQDGTSRKPGMMHGTSAGQEAGKGSTHRASPPGQACPALGPAPPGEGAAGSVRPAGEHTRPHSAAAAVRLCRCDTTQTTRHRQGRPPAQMTADAPGSPSATALLAHLQSARWAARSRACITDSAAGLPCLTVNRCHILSGLCQQQAASVTSELLVLNPCQSTELRQTAGGQQPAGGPPASCHSGEAGAAWPCSLSAWCCRASTSGSRSRESLAAAWASCCSSCASPSALCSGVRASARLMLLVLCRW